jgi:signal transduction histidine kinase
MKKAPANIAIAWNTAEIPVSRGAAGAAEARSQELPASDRIVARPKIRSQEAARKMAHDLQNPISGILAATQYLIEDAGPNLENHHLIALKAIEASGFRLLRLIDNLVAVSAGSARAKRAEKRLRAGSASSGVF